MLNKGATVNEKGLEPNKSGTYETICLGSRVILPADANGFAIPQRLAPQTLVKAEVVPQQAGPSDAPVTGNVPRHT